MKTGSLVRFAAWTLLVSACNAPIMFDTGGDAGTAAPRCSSDIDCHLRSLHCDAVSGSCVPCVHDSHCALPLPFCSQLIHECVGCSVDADCPAGQRCEPTTNRCLPSCLGGAACPPNTTCNALGVCRQCGQDLDCPTGSFCNTVTGQCVGCTLDSHCPSTTPRCNPSSNVCVRCLSSTDCGNENPYCNPTTGKCVDDDFIDSGPEGHN